MEDLDRLLCGCIQGWWYCLFCNPENYIRSTPPNVRHNLWKRSVLERRLLAEGTPINRVRKVVFERCQFLSTNKTDRLSEKEGIPPENETIEKNK